MSLKRPSHRSLFFQIHYLASFSLTRLYSISNASGETWVALRGDASQVFENAAAAHYEEWDHNNLDAVPESMRGPVWSGMGKEYLAYGVDLRRGRARPGDITVSWVHSYFDDGEEFTDPLDRESIMPGLAAQIKKDLRIARELLNFFHQRGGVRDADVDRDYTGDPLLEAEGVNAIRAELRRARQVMDERLAAINYAIVRAEPAVRAYVEITYVAYIPKWGLSDRMRGVNLDFRTFDPRVTHVLDHLHHRVPVLYPVDEPYRPRFTESETQGAESIRNAQQFVYWLQSTAHWPVVVKALTAPRKLYGITPEQETANPTAYAPKLERWTNLQETAHLLMGDFLHSVNSPPLLQLTAANVMLVDTARLLLEPPTELRLGLRAIANRNSDACELLTEALQRGWPFRVVYHRAFLDDLVVLDDVGAAAERDAVDTILLVTDSEHIDVTREWSRYLRRVAMLLSRPNAKAFLCLGGILWRLALLFGEEYLDDWKRDLLGPTASVILGRSGVQPVQGYWGNAVTEKEKDILLGLTRSRLIGTTRTWFPSTSLLARHGFHDGEWSSVEERFVLERYESLQRGETIYRPLTIDEWDAELAQYKTGRLLRNSQVRPTSFEIELLLDDVRRELGGSWDGATVAHINDSISV